jgi:hypothetical protein
MIEEIITVPDVLMAPLRFGDPEQIATLHMIEREIELDRMYSDNRGL